MNRLLSIGFPLPFVQVDNYTAFTAPSYFDYRLLVVDPESITRNVKDLLEGTREFDAFDGRPVLNSSGNADIVSAVDQLRRRAEETERLLDSGGVVIVIGRPNATRGGLVGFEGCDRYHWLPAPPGVSWSPPMLRAAEGKVTRIIDETHPAAGFLRTYRNEIAYRAVFDDRQRAFREQGRVIAAGGVGAPIAAEFRVLGGKVLFLPAMGEPGASVRSKIAEALVELGNALLRDSAGNEAPFWASKVDVPGLAPIEESLESARKDEAEAAERVAAAAEQFDELARYRRLLFESGPVLRDAVLDALRVLGLTVTPGEDDELPLVEAEGLQALLETEGSREQVVEWPYIRLQRKLEERLLKSGEPLRGLIVVNGYRETAPESRGQEYSDALRIACQNYRYCLVTAGVLFEMACRALDGAPEAELLGMRRRLLSTNGLLDREIALGLKEPPQKEPLF